MTEATETDDEDHAWEARYGGAVYTFGMALRTLHDTNPWPDQSLLPKAMIHLATELWGHCFSQTEIRSALEAAIEELPRYAAGNEIRP